MTQALYAHMNNKKIKIKKKRIIGIRMGIGQENHCEMLLPRGFQESSNTLFHFSNCFLRSAAIGGTH
jgi:hypothetical protein